MGPFARLAAAAACILTGAAALASTSEINVDLKLDSGDAICGERVRGVITIENFSPDVLDVDYAGSSDRLFVEVYRSADGSQLERVSSGKFTAPFKLNGGKAQKLEVFLGDHYGLGSEGQFIAKPVLVHGGMRYEGALRAFSVVPGMKIGGAAQIFGDAQGLRREFSLVYWSRGGKDHLFLAARDEGGAARPWRTRDLGPLMRITRPTISVLPSGVVIVIHRCDPDNFLRNELWSTRKELVFRKRDVIADPETAGQARVHEIFKEGGEVAPKARPWWKFW